jgi:HD-like signal output (HDOD) protein
MDCPVFHRPSPGPASHATAPGTPRSRHISRAPHADRHQLALRRLFERISESAKLPLGIQRILQVTADKAASIDDLCQAIRADEMLAARIVRRVNSSFFGIEREIDDLHTALGLLGFRETRSTCLAACFEGFYKTSADHRRYSGGSLWRHCRAAAQIAERLAGSVEAVESDEAYAAGLLHHVGTTLLATHLRQHFCQLLELVVPNQPMRAIERQVLSFDQAELGAFVVRHWGLSMAITDAIRYYRYPEQYAGPHRQHVHILCLSDFLCHQAGIASVGVPHVGPPRDDVLQSLGFTRASLKRLSSDTFASLAEPDAR